MTPWIPDAVAPFAAIALMAGVFGFFLLERFPAELIAFCGAALALALGLVGAKDVGAALSNSAPATIAAMFILSAALVRSGALETAVAGLGRLVEARPMTGLVAFFLSAAAASALMNNTPVMIVLIPVAMGLARQASISSSKLLMPLSFMVILGGTCTMIGTSTNLLVDGMVRDLGMPPFHLFEITPVGLVAALAGGAYLALVGQRLLPDRGPGVADVGSSSRSWTTELFLPEGSPLVGKALTEIEALERKGTRVIDVLRGDQSMRRELQGLRLEPGDRIVLRTRDTEIAGLREGNEKGLTLTGTEPGRSIRTELTEVLVTSRSRALGRTLRALTLRRRFGVYPLALHRSGHQVAGSPDDLPLEVGDVLMVDGPADGIARLSEALGLVSLGRTDARAYRRNKVPIAIGVLAGVVLLAAFGVAQILVLALIGVAVVLVTGCVDMDEALASIDGRLLLLIVSMLILGSAFQSSGAMQMVVDALEPVLDRSGPLVALILVYALTSFLTELVTNNAVAVLLTPLAAGIASQLGLDPRPFAVAVMFGASASFATPIGYQTNTMVYNAGGYRFRDFLRVGLPMNFVVGAATVAAIAWMWPLRLPG
ncbi:SLC13 family permease [Tropicimonas sp. IMCC34043]|uniref:SLC13 family permease n=1 Tax=Tropicimonas sp. IMCC34043 TaxID=2248760 RepID=UPI000E220811|nr:SLC13 family permease [Tropicimonas sp. IMCC34043]